MTDVLAARFAFARLVVRDLQKQAAFYREVFGYGEGQFIRDAINGRPIEEIILSGPDGKVELIILQFLEGPDPSPTGVMIGFFTQDLEALEARILAAGGAVVQAIGSLQMGERPARFALYADPEGYQLEVIER